AIGVGGFVGAQLSPYIVAGLDAVVLEMIFLGFVLFALSRLYFKTVEHRDMKTVNPVLLFAIGTVIGVFSISIGVGGSILLVPILVGFLHVPLKNAVSAGLFFVVFSSISGFIGFSLNGQIDFESGVLIGIASMAGVALGIWFKHRSSDLLQKRLIVLFYLVVALYFIYRLVMQHG
ncbi:MAG: sulfite exporter TauE/SafE family protein, partial [Sulfurimonadaceae bacterium]|nr:sulfite exporter TauE/SafE family protein [Sulfurimonadaceae bacterium]